MADFSKLKRERQKMPQFVSIALAERNLTSEFESRPAYQQNDYLSWITRAKMEKTVQKRLHQMLDELEKGGVYMNMEHPASAKK